MPELVLPTAGKMWKISSRNCAASAATQMWEIGGEYTDHESGGRTDRREFRRLLERCGTTPL